MRDIGEQGRTPFNPVSDNDHILLVTTTNLSERQGEKYLTFDKCDFSYLQIDFSYSK
jgi:hypothetical protein